MYKYQELELPPHYAFFYDWVAFRILRIALTLIFFANFAIIFQEISSLHVHNYFLRFSTNALLS